MRHGILKTFKNRKIKKQSQEKQKQNNPEKL
jgi:hypothetical protein